MAIFTTQLLQGRKPVIFGDGSEKRDYVFIDDIVVANLSALRYNGWGVGCGPGKGDRRLPSISSSPRRTALQERAVLRSQIASWRKSLGRVDYGKGYSWEGLFQEGVKLLERLAQEDRVRIRPPKRNLQVKLVRPLPNGNDFVAYIDAIGYLDGTRCLIEWKTTTSRYPEEPEGLLALDPQLLCYSWISGVSYVALVVFVRKRLPEIQYLRTMHSVKSLARWSSKPSGRSRPASSSRTVAFAFLRTAASDAPIRGSA